MIDRTGQVWEMSIVGDVYVAVILVLGSSVEVDFFGREYTVQHVVNLSEWTMGEWGCGHVHDEREDYDARWESRPLEFERLA